MLILSYNQDMKSNVGKVYKIVSIVVLGLCLYGMLLPLLSPIMEKMLPRIWVCPFLRITGSECPFCGITRGVTSLYRLNFDSASVLSMIVFLLALVETAFRTMIILTVSGLRQKTIKGIIFTDITYHTLLVVLTSIYVIIFLATNF